ncbi:MAG: hypothetical protein GX328_00280 [Clostridiaceae bacterium]|nr:hypothetical protein [Clostridiaceae bacterium]
MDILFHTKPEEQAKYKSIKKINGKRFLILLLVFVFLLSSCSILSKDSKEKTEPDSNNPEVSLDEEYTETKETQLASKPDNESSVLRIYWQVRDNYNPLNTFDYSGRAAFQLMYRSIFKINNANVLSMDLARSASYIADKNLYRIELVPGITYSDGTLITAKDCAASILQYKENLANYFALNEVTQDNDEIESEEMEDQSIESNNNLLEIMQKYPDLFTANNNFQTQHDEDFLFAGTLKNELKLLSLIDEIIINNEYTFEINLRDPDVLEATDQEETDQTDLYDNPEITDNIEEVDQNDEITENTEENNSESDEETIDLEKRIYYEKDPGLLFALTMPIIPEKSVSSASLPSVSSTDYIIEKNEQGNILLSTNSPDVPLQKIQLLPFPNITSAMTALLENELDFIYLNEHNFNIYSKQNNANILSFPGQRYYYLSFGNGETINIPEIKEAIINVWQIRDDLASSLSGNQTINNLPLHYNDQAIYEFNLFEQKYDSLDAQTIHELENLDIELKVIVPDSTLERNWAFTLREKMLGMNIILDFEYVECDLYQTVLEQGNYDLAFNSIDLPYPMSILDAFELIKPSTMASLTNSEAELHKEINSYFYSVDRKIDPKILSEKNNSYREFITGKYSELDILGIGFAPVGILLSKNIEGSTESHLAEPYSGLEDLWVWQ